MRRAVQPPSRRGESGQAAVEAALTLPLTLFLILGTIQFFALEQARLLSQYAVSRAARVGAVHRARCKPMVDAALLALLPSIARTDDSAHTVAAFQAHSNNQYGAQDQGRTGNIVWIDIRNPTSIPANSAELFDLPVTDGGNADEQIGGRVDTMTRFELRMVFWYPLRLPFVDWVIGRMVQAHYGYSNYTAMNPISPGQAHANWTRVQAFSSDADIGTELQARLGRGQWDVPIRVSYVTRLMTPPNPNGFTTKCY